MIKIGCQTYTWQMSGERYLNRLDHIIGLAGRAGFAGIESELQFLGTLRDPGLMRAHLDQAGIALAALCIVHDWRGARESDAERTSADWTIEFIARHFPDTLLNVCPMPGIDRSDLRGRQDSQLACMNALAARAADRGVVAAYHPNSPAGSVCRVASDYERMLDGLDSRVLKWVPDIGHIAKGGIEVMGLLQRYRPLVAHVHYKDMTPDGTWQCMGEGTLDFAAVTSYLANSSYDGWIVVEDEGAEAEHDPDRTALRDGQYMARTIAPLFG
ncbi:MAG: sugar phosphate isomerase/epimerase [Bradyrhizobium sp.]|nr:sugar phosphate isomerase/epimerase [Bradyrhizobium sp.]